MIVNTTFDKPRAPHTKTQLFRLSFVFLSVLFIALALLVGVQAKRPSVAISSANSERDKPSGADYSFISVGGDNHAVSLPNPSELVSSRAKLASLEPQSSTDIAIDFNNDVPGTVISNQYPFVTFSTDGPFFPVINRNAHFETSGFLDRGPVDNANSHFAPLYIHFSTPVNTLTFQIIGFDDYNSNLAKVYIRTVGTPPGQWTVVLGINRFFPEPNRAQMHLGPTQGIVEVEIRDIRDSGGLAFDNFSFSVPNAFPPAPTGLAATVTGQTVELKWQATTSTTGYRIKRSTTSGGGYQEVGTVFSPTTTFTDEKV